MATASCSLWDVYSNGLHGNPVIRNSGPTTFTTPIIAAANLPPFQSPRIIDISDETKPVVVSRLYLEIHNPKNCDKVLPDLAGLSSFTLSQLITDGM